MTKNKDQLLRRASAAIHTGNLDEAAEILNALKVEYPLSPSVARLWCLLARRTGKTAAVPDYAAKIYEHVEGDLHKARWAHIMGTANFILLNLEAAHNNFTCVLEHLIVLIRTGKVPKNKKPKNISSDNQNVFSTGQAEQLLWETCAKLATHDIQAFPFAGTLLGIVRNGALLEFDKDLDIAVWVESLEQCCAELEKNGWVKVQMGIDYSNYRDYVHEDTGITLDVCGLTHTNKQQILGGFSLPDRPAAYQRVSVFPVFELLQRDTAFGQAWFPQQPEIILN
ncbi:MAG: cytidyltransferase, partial [Betaproteobacteria bacterium]|nr:cytidyltransferase [Betaproteobacteria bacterium]